MRKHQILLKRTITGIIFVAVLVAAIMWNKYSIALLFGVFAMLGLNEFLALMRKNGFSPNSILCNVVAVAIYVIIALHSFHWFDLEYLLLIFPLLIIIVVSELFRKHDYPVSNMGFSILGILYIIFPFATLNFFAYNEPFYDKLLLVQNDFGLLLGFFVILWANDTGAYLVGSKLGKHKLFERISPNKTWEGFFGGAALSITTAILFAYFSDSKTIHWIIVSIIVVVFGTLGDLTESQIKRSTGVKDSGNLLPGHGGVLDRFDGVLFAAPFVLTYFFVLVNMM
jgi:phosphatidate cytidylyltransferase